MRRLFNLLFPVLLFVLLAQAHLVSLGASPEESAPSDSAPTAERPAARNTAFHLTMRDGVKIAVDLWLPESALGESKQKLPVVLEMTRYWRELQPASPQIEFSRMAMTANRWNEAGYAFAIIDSRGTGASHGVWQAPWAPAEIADYREVAGWMAKQPWSNGRVTATGVSYVGTTADWLAAADPVAPGKSPVVAVIPKFGVFDAYGHVSHPGGVMNEWFVTKWAEFGESLDKNDLTLLAQMMGFDPQMARMMVKGVKPVDGEGGEAALEGAVKEHEANIKLLEVVNQLDYRDSEFPDLTMRIGTISPYGAREHFEAAGVPSLIWSSWMDSAAAAGALARFATFDTPHRLIIGSWNHGGGMDCDPFLSERGPPVPSRQEMAKIDEAFLRRFAKPDAAPADLTGIAPGLPAAGEIVYWVMGAREWRTAKQWPPENTKQVQIAGDDKGLALWRDAGAFKAFEVTPHESVSSGDGTRWRTQLGGSEVQYRGVTWPKEHCLVLDSEVQRWSIPLASTPELKLNLTPTAADGAVHVYLCAVSPEGRQVVLSEGMLRLMHANPAGAVRAPYAGMVPGTEYSYCKRDAVEVKAGQPMDVTVRLLPVAAEIPAEWNLRLVVAANDHGNFKLYGAGFTVNSLSLNIHGLVEVLEMPPMPEEQVPPPTGYADPGSASSATISMQAADNEESDFTAHWDREWQHLAKQRLGMYPWEGELRHRLSSIEDAELLLYLGYLLAYMPDSDIAAMRPRHLINNVHMALHAVRNAPWKEQITDDLFRHYVLPYRAGREPIEMEWEEWKAPERVDEWIHRDELRELAQGPLTNGRREFLWREVIARELWPRVRDLPLYEAALEVNRWCAEWTGFTANSSARDQGPLTTMQRGEGRCGELTIFYVCAARAVGIPARQCYTPYWSVNDNNHAWVEVWADGRWWYLGAAEPDRELDRGWFARAASRAGVVFSLAFGGDVDAGEEEVYQRHPDCTIINSTHVYGDSCTVSVALEDRAMMGYQVTVHVVNFGSPRAVARLMVGETITLGGGEFLFTANGPRGPVSGVATTTVQLETGEWRVLEKLTVTLSAGHFVNLTSGDGSVHWLRYPIAERRSVPPRGHTAPAEKSEEYAALVQAGLRVSSEVRAELQQRHKAGRARIKALREERSKIPEWVLELDDVEARDALIRQLKRAGPAAWRLGVKPYGPKDPRSWNQFALYRAVVLETWDDKALFEVQPFHVNLWSGGVAFSWSEDGLSAEELNRWEVSHRVGEETAAWRYDEHWSEASGSVYSGMRSWEGEWLHNEYLEFDPRTGSWYYPKEANPCLGSLHALFSTYELIERRSRLGHVQTPQQTAAMKRGTVSELAILGVKLLRDGSKIARLTPDGERLEVRHNGHWQVFDFRVDWSDLRRAWRDQQAGRSSPISSSSKLPVPNRTITVTLTQAGEPASQVQAFQGVALTRFADGYFQPLPFNQGLRTDGKGNATAEVQPGDYFVFTVTRNRRGDACYRCYPVAVAAQTGGRVTVECGIPVEQMRPEDLLERTLKQWPETQLMSSDASTTLKMAAGGKPLLMLVVDASTEPGKRMLDALPAMAEAASQHTASVRSLLVTVGEAEAGELPAGVSLLRDKDGALSKALGAKTLPAVILLGASGDDSVPATHLWTEGYNPSIHGLVVAGLAQLPTGDE